MREWVGGDPLGNTVGSEQSEERQLQLIVFCYDNISN